MRSLAALEQNATKVNEDAVKPRNTTTQHDNSCEIYLCPHGSEFCLHLVETANFLCVLGLNLPQLALTCAHLQKKSSQ